MAEIVNIADLYRRSGRDFIVTRHQYGKGDAVRVKDSRLVGAFESYITSGPGCGRVRVFVEGTVVVLDQDGIEAVSAEARHA